jgi:hypothetical protein
MAVLIFTASVGEYKASLYALMTYSHQGDLKAAEPVARYLFYRSHLLDRHTEVRCVGYAAVRPYIENGLPAIQFITNNNYRTD